MRGERLKHTLILWTKLGSPKRTRYLRENHIFYSIGDNCTIMSRTIPLYARLIKIGNNVHLASGVKLITHDITHAMLNKSSYVKEKAGADYRFREKVGCIEIGDDVFVGSGTTILQNVRIGSRVIIGAGSLVNRDIPDNSVAVGVPAKVIGTLDDYVERRMKEEAYPDDMSPHDGKKTRELRISEDAVAWCWDRFNKEKSTAK